MKSDDFFNLILIAMFVLLPVSLAISTTKQITATDWLYRHVVWINEYLHGSWSPILEYPPLFHWMMLPFVAINFPMYLMQIVFAIVNFAVIYWFINKTHGLETFLIVGFILGSSLIYMQVSSAMMPQALDLLFFFPAVYLYLNKKYGFSVLLLFFLMLMHEASLLFMSALFIHALLYRRYRFCALMLIPLLLLSPLYYNYFIQTFVQSTFNEVVYQWNWTAQTIYDQWFYTPFWHFFVTSGIIAWLFLPKAVNKLRKRKFYISEKQILYLLWLFCFIPYAFVDIWRAMTFTIIPFYFFIGSVLSDKEKIKYDKKQNEQKEYFEELKTLKENLRE